MFSTFNEVNKSNSIIFNSVAKYEDQKNKLWEHFYGVEIETD